MKRTSIWIFAIFFVLQCCISGCTHFDDSSSGTLGEASTSTTTHTSIVDEETSTTTSTDQTTGNTIITSSITSTQITSQEPICEGTVAFEEFKSVEELLYWIHNDNGKGSMFRQAIKGLQLDRIMIIEAVDDTFTLEYIRTFQKGSGCDAQIEYYFISEKGERVCLYVHLRDMHAPVEDIKKYVKSSNLDNAYLNHFKFSYRDIIMPTTTNAATITTAASSGENDKEDTVTINVGEYFAASGKRMVDLKDVSKDEFLKKYPIILPENFTTVDFYYEIPTEAGLRFNEVEDGYVRCESNDGRSNLYVYVCDTKYIGHSCIWNRNAEPKKSRINNVDVIISQQEKGVYKGQFEKNGYYYTFETSNMAQQDVVSALKDLTKI